MQFVAQQDGRVRVIKSGVVQPNDYLTLAVNNAGECGLLGLAVAPDYAVSGRVYVYFCGQGTSDTFVSRFTRSLVDPMRADPASQFNLVWPDGNAFLIQPFGNHKGGNVAFGPDGFLYIGTGDGGGSNDPGHRAQNPLSLLGKMLRIDVTSVALTHPTGYVVPPGNPYVNRSDVLNEIWDMGLRNPWRWSFDSPAHGGTGALIIADVGQGRWEEVNYEPAGTGRRNYGWRNREGAHVNVDVPALPGPFLDPGLSVTDPIHEYPSTEGNSITGGFVYRGSALSGFFAGRYFFADFIRSRVWSVALNVDPITHEGTVVAGSLVEHTAALGLGAQLPSSFGMDAAGELYICAYGSGRIYKLVPAVVSDLRGAQETPAAVDVQAPFTVSGWVGDFAAQSGPGVSAVHLWAAPVSGGGAIFLGQSYGVPRADIAAQFGDDFANSGFSVQVNAIPFGRYNVIAYAFSAVTGTFHGFSVRTFQITAEAVLAIESPAGGASLPGKVDLSGHALDLSAASGTGVDTLHIWGLAPGGGAVFIGAATYGAARPDVASIYGGQFLNSGWSITAADLAPGPWTFVVYLHSQVTNSFRLARIVNVTVTDGLRMFVDSPANNQVFPPGSARDISGWAVDVGAGAGTGIDVVHVWAIDLGTSAASFLGSATMGIDRPDVATAFGSQQFRLSGFRLLFNLPMGSYNLVMYAHSTRTMNFDIARVVHIEIR